MQRGMISFSPSQVAFLKNILAESSLSASRLSQHILLASDEIVRLEVNQEEVESLLDILPAPSSDTSPELGEIRTQLVSFLQ
ncbi:MAG: hypothetical protein H6773_03835 [Pseudomonadales bacterium]|nr:hypothetical protein [Candidatus Woesebacteria bacterium]MCB9801288.1 hypothetical protein [Pseudomonadales bacterium]